MKTRSLLATLAVVGCATSASATSPYDLPYALQWSFQTGDAGSESATHMDVTSDGVAHLMTRASNTQTFGQGTTNSVQSDVGGVNAKGQLVYGTTISSMPGIVSPSQNYATGVHASGGQVFYSTYSNNNAHWNDPGSAQDPVNEIGKASNHPMVWSINSPLVATTGQIDGNNSLSTAIDNRNSISIYSDNFGTLRADGNQPVTTGLSVLGTQIRTADSAMRKSTLDLIMVGDMVNGDFGTSGDYGGYNLRNSGSANAYLPGIGRYNPTTKVLDGPAFQPILTYTGAEPTWSNMGTFAGAGVDQASGWYYGGGIAQSRSESKSNGWDPDGSGPASPIAFGPSIPAVFTDDHRATSPGIGVAYDNSNALQYAVTWDTAGYDIINDITGLGDGSNAAIWSGEKADNAYFEKRDSTGAVVWSVDLDLSAGTDPERVSQVRVAADGSIFVQGYFTNSAGHGVGDNSGGRDSFLMKYDASGNEIWRTLVAGGGTETASDGTNLGIKSYIYATTDGQWANPAGYVNPGGNDILLQKLVPGDFVASGIVDMADVLFADAATVVSSAVDTYDFDGDGDSDFMDISFFYLNVLDNTPGDTDGDGDIDDADLGTAFANYTGPVGLAGGRNALDGDTDSDGDVDDSDLGTAFSGYTGPLGPASVPEPTSLALIGLGGLALIRRRRA